MIFLFIIFFRLLILAARLTVLAFMAAVWLLIAVGILILACCGHYRRRGRRAYYPRFRWHII